jgi:cobalamin-dependent methionine synthase I
MDIDPADQMEQTIRTEVFSRKLFRLRKSCFEHYNPHFITTVLFNPSADGGETQIDWTLLFDTAEMRETVIKAHKADEGQKQNIEKLEKYITKLHSESTAK